MAATSHIDPAAPGDHTHLPLGTNADGLWSLPQIEYIQADAYWQDRRGWHKPLNGFFDGKAKYRNKPQFFIEYGPQTADVENYRVAHNEPYPFAIWQREFRVVGWIGIDARPARRCGGTMRSGTRSSSTSASRR